MHHVRNGLYVKRLDDGAVLITKKDGPDGPVLFEQAIPKDAWCSLVAAVSDGGATPQNIELAQIVHGCTKPRPTTP